MSIIKLNLPKPQPKIYEIKIGKNILKTLPQFLKKYKNIHRFIIITDSKVKQIAGNQLLQTFKKAALKADTITFPAGEKFKTEATHQKIIHAMLAKKCGRDTMILALGGGVVGDIAGYVAATFMRGIPYIQIPTSFLGMVDSSIGGKVGVDTPFGKNLVGAFWHPEAVIIDIAFLRALPEAQLLNGLMESAKIFLTYDAKYFDLLNQNFPRILKKDERLLEKIIVRSVELKVGVVVRDEHDLNERMVLNWGHTIGHALEHLSKYRIPHGIAVALGILVESRIAVLLGILSEHEFNNLAAAFKVFGIDAGTIGEFTSDAIIKTTLRDKKSSNGKIKYVLLEKIGKVKTLKGNFGHSIDRSIVKKALKYFTK